MKKIDKKTENRFSMYKVVLYLISLNTVLISMYAGLQSVVTLFKDMVTELGSLMQQKLQITTGLSTDKKVAKENLVKMTRVVGGAISSYADEIGDNDLMEKVQHSKSELKESRDEVLIDICRNYYDLGNTYIGFITPYGVDAIMLQTFLVLINLFEAKSPQPTEAREHSATLTKEISKKDKEVRKLLKNRLDRVISVLEPTNSIFVSDYYKSRMIIDLGTRHKKVDVVPVDPDAFAYMTGTITDINGEPIEDALVEVIGESATYIDVTDEDGLYFVEGIADGTYDLRVTADGKQFIDVFNVVFKADDEAQNDFVMEDEVVPTPEV